MSDPIGSALFLAALVGLGLWLETINGKRGLVDWLFTPIPLGVGGIIVLIERTAFV